MENIPFKAGQLAELRSFGFGYRGAWFRCKIKEFTERNGMLGHISEYYDYADEKLTWTKLYQLPIGNTKRKHSELMMRPQYPPICNEKQMPHVSEISEVTVIVCDSWKVGDLVDLFHTGCYWCGRITQLFDDQKAQIELRPPPLGEGSSYKALLKDLRPSLDWSLQHGWTLPTQEDGFGHPCARLVKPINRGIEDVSIFAGLHARLLSFPHVSSNTSTPLSEVKSTNTLEINKRLCGTTLTKEQKNDIEKSASHGCGESNIRKTSQVDTAYRGSTIEQEAAVVEDGMNRKRLRASGGDILNSRHSNTLEATIMDLEQYINKVKWLKKILQHEISSSKNQRPSSNNHGFGGI
ncbi:uncharacterized protein LOC130991283 [Salvia miltiorrhiza]|uniref:uncharacterized protein LOC130991283 n=1 Tax=Salvia miltiorrhiza TaxID=226208 RepID=UPI0025ABED6A|nr:uncharacterized protein LOC130991283 [Salvia miltiorrhiza]